MTWLDALTFDTVVVHQVEQLPSLKATLTVVHDDCLVLRDVLVMWDTDAPQQLQGLYIVPREKVMGIQILDPPKP